MTPRSGSGGSAGVGASGETPLAETSRCSPRATGMLASAPAASDPSLEAEKGQYAIYSTSFVRSERQQRQRTRGTPRRARPTSRDQLSLSASRLCEESVLAISAILFPWYRAARPVHCGRFGDCGRKRFDVAIGRIIENENFGHECRLVSAELARAGKSARSQAIEIACSRALHVDFPEAQLRRTRRGGAAETLPHLAQSSSPHCFR